MPLSKAESGRLISFTSDIAREAGAILKQGFTKVRHVRMKGKIDPVTEFDVRSEKFIKGAIQKTFPDHDILAEESGGEDKKSPYRWIIDPLDGTVNYAHEIPVYCVSVGIEYEGVCTVGVVYDPERDELFTAGRGLGAKLNNQHISVSSESRLDGAILATGFAYDIRTARKNNLGLFARMVKSAQAVRRLGSAALDLCWTACGRFDGFWELGLHPWDSAASIVIVQEAGGKVTQLDGGPYSIYNFGILASNGRLHRQMQKVLVRRRGR